MAKDLTAALQALTEQAQGQTSRVNKTLPAAKDATAIPERTGSSGPIYSTAASGNTLELKDEKTIITSDGLFTIYFPNTAETTAGDKVLTLGAIKSVDVPP